MISSDETQRILADYRAGKPMVEIGWKYRHGLDVIRRIVQEAGVPRRRFVTPWRCRVVFPPKQIVPR